MRTLLAGSDTELQEESPVGTESVCRALRALKEAERLSPAEALKLLEQLEEPLQRHLGRYYRDLEHQLADAGVESHTALRLRRTPPWRSRRTGRSRPRPAAACRFTRLMRCARPRWPVARLCRRLRAP